VLGDDSILKCDNRPRKTNEMYVWMLKERNPSAVKGIVSTTRAWVMVDIVDRSSREETTFELRRADCFLHPVVMTNFVDELRRDVQHTMV